MSAHRREACCGTGSPSGRQRGKAADLSQAILDAIIDAFEAHSTMSKQAPDSRRVQEGLKDVLPGRQSRLHEKCALTRAMW
jgi:hypothetical protein